MPPYFGLALGRQGLDERKEEHRQQYPKMRDRDFVQIAGPEATAEDLKPAFLSELRKSPGCPQNEKALNAMFDRAVEEAKAADRKRRRQPVSGQWYAYMFKYDD